MLILYKKGRYYHSVITFYAFAVDNKKTFMHFLAGIVEEKFPDILNFGDELQHAERASRVSGDAIVKNLVNPEMMYRTSHVLMR